MRRRRSCRCRFVRCRTGRARRFSAGWPGIDRSGCRVAFCGERAKDRRGKSKVGETGQVGNSLSVSVCRQCVRVNALRGRETTRAIRAVQMSAGDKDRSASTASVVRSRRPDHVTQPRSTNTARLIWRRIWRDQVPATFSAARGTRRPLRFLSRCQSAKITWPTRAEELWVRCPGLAFRPRFTTGGAGRPRLLSAGGQP